ncbi:transposase [Streptomyces coelicoflavus]|uniref:transposase n=1 Tax=Streptomyces coelicoflavus TaxID=285562 RepID=UPI0036B2DB45
MDPRQVPSLQVRSTLRLFDQASDSPPRESARLGKLRYVVEQTFALLHQFKRLAVRWERRLELHDALLSLGCSLICWRRLKKTGA